tara:strand:+ start:129 stop:359 length:231 start_codon:yes stop_codon:yes gene_type:complete
MGISIWQIVLVLVIIVILFGAGKIPRVMGDIAKGIKSFKAGMKEGENEEIETEAETIDDSKTKETKAKRTSKKSKK